MGCAEWRLVGQNPHAIERLVAERRAADDKQAQTQARLQAIEQQRTEASRAVLAHIGDDREFAQLCPAGWKVRPEGKLLPDTLAELLGYSARADVVLEKLDDSIRLWIEFEVSRRPDHGDGAIAKACRSSVSAVAAARQRLQLPAAPRS